MRFKDRGSILSHCSFGATVGQVKKTSRESQNGNKLNRKRAVVAGDQLSPLFWKEAEPPCWLFITLNLQVEGIPILTTSKTLKLLLLILTRLNNYKASGFLFKAWKFT